MMYSGTTLTRTWEIKNQQDVFEALVSSGKEPMLMFIKNQSHPDFQKTRFLSAGFYCIVTILCFLYFKNLAF